MGLNVTEDAGPDERLVHHGLPTAVTLGFHFFFHKGKDLFPRRLQLGKTLAHQRVDEGVAEFMYDRIQMSIDENGMLTLVKHGLSQAEDAVVFRRPSGALEGQPVGGAAVVGGQGENESAGSDLAEIGSEPIQMDVRADKISRPGRYQIIKILMVSKKSHEIRIFSEAPNLV